MKKAITAKEQAAALETAIGCVEQRWEENLSCAEQGDPLCVEWNNEYNHSLNVLEEFLSMAKQLIRDHEREYQNVKAYYREVRDRGDAWGSALNEQFNIAEELHRRNAYIPEHWEFNPSPIAVTPPHDFYKDCPAAALVEFGNVLERFISFLSTRGHGY